MGGQVPDDARRVDAALTDIGPGGTQDVGHLLAVGGDLPRRVAQMAEVEPLGGQPVEVLDPVARAVEVVQVDHQPGVGPVDLAQHLDGVGEIAHGRDRHELEVDGQPVCRREIAEPPEGVEIEGPIVHPDARQHAARPQLGADGELRLVDARVEALEDARQLDVVHGYAGLRERRLGGGEQLGLGGQGVVVARQAVTDQPRADVVIAGAVGDPHEIVGGLVDDRQMRQRISLPRNGSRGVHRQSVAAWWMVLPGE